MEIEIKRILAEVTSLCMVFKRPASHGSLYQSAWYHKLYYGKINANEESVTVKQNTSATAVSHLPLSNVVRAEALSVVATPQPPA